MRGSLDMAGPPGLRRAVSVPAAPGPSAVLQPGVGTLRRVPICVPDEPEPASASSRQACRQRPEIRDLQVFLMLPKPKVAGSRPVVRLHKAASPALFVPP